MENKKNKEKGKKILIFFVLYFIIYFDYKKMRAPYIKYSLRFDRTRRLGYEKV